MSLTAPLQHDFLTGERMLQAAGVGFVRAGLSWGGGQEISTAAGAGGAVLPVAFGPPGTGGLPS